MIFFHAGNIGSGHTNQLCAVRFSTPTQFLKRKFDIGFSMLKSKNKII
jgi:hypothetical protein